MTEKSPPSQHENWNAVGIETVLQLEEIEIVRLCDTRGARDRFDTDSALEPPERLGLAFSGGGIRSASVNLGLLQAFARSGLLKQTHYISAVSGGGYALGWLTAWIARVGFKRVNDELAWNSDTGKRPPSPQPDVYQRYLEPDPIHFLRRYISYLVPRSGLGSGDTLAAAAIYLRNLLLVQSLVAFAVVGLLALGQLLAPPLLWTWLSSPVAAPIFLAIVATLGLLLGASAGRSLGDLARNQLPAGSFPTGGAAEILGAVLCISLWLGLPSLLRAFTAVEVIFVAAALTIASLCVAWASSSWKQPKQPALKAVGAEGATFLQLASALLAGVLTAVLFWGLRVWLISNGNLPAATEKQVVMSTNYVLFGLPALFTGFALISFLYIGFRGDSMPDAKREWLGRLAGYYLYFALSAGVFFSIAMLGPALFDWVFHQPHGLAAGLALKWLLPGGWVFTTASGLFAARSPSTGKNRKNTPLELLAVVAPPLFLAGVMLLASYATYVVTHYVSSFDYLPHGYLQAAPPKIATPYPCCCSHCSARKPDTSSVWQRFYPFKALGDAKSNSQPYRWIERYKTRIVKRYKESDDPSRAAVLLSAIALVSASLLWILSRRITVNEFSLHLFYRNRLVRTFLGASNPKRKTKSNRFTGFALDDDLPLGSLQQGAFDGPYPIWNTALNLTSGEDLAWQQRKAASFIYSPLFCGWDYFSPQRVSAGHLSNLGYRAVAKCKEHGAGNGKGYGGKLGAPFLGTAIAASGAAISPNWGYHTKPAIAALLAVFNIRIGWWTGNTRSDEGAKLYAPKAGYFLRELLGATGQDGTFVYLSDGGHFENLGIYELVRRRVRFIVACDADADPTYGFGDLANAVEKCRVDFGVQIRMARYSSICPKRDGKNSRVHYAIGLIDYSTVQQDNSHESPGSGVLLYIKSSLTGDEEAQVLGQKASDSVFPHDTTLNQFFDETKFEAYRELGDHLGSFVWTQFLTAPATDHKEPPKDQHESCEQIREFFNVYLRNEWKKNKESKPESELEAL